MPSGIARLDPPGPVPARLWLLDLTVEGHADHALLTPDERARLPRMVPEVRRRLVSRRTHLARIVAEVAGVDTEALRLEVDRGRLLVSAGGRTVVPSTSHTGDVGVVAIGSQPVGVDAEASSLPAWEALGIGRDLFHPEEVAWIGDGDGHVERFMEVWVRKEAVVKVTGDGLSRRLDSFAVHPSSGVEPVTGADDLAGVATTSLAIPGTVAALAWVT